jgi:hypothetical protein
VSEITDQMIDDILSTAFEGGINYWCDETMILRLSDAYAFKRDEFDGELHRRWASQVPSTPMGLIAICEADDFERTWHPLDRERIERGIRTAAREFAGESVEEWYESHDASDADIAVQLAIFGKVVYG